MLLIKEAKQLYVNDNNIDVNLKGNVFAIDATTIDLCLSTFYWAAFRSTKSGIKLHTQLDLKTSIPEFILFSNALVHNVNALDYISFEANSFYVTDRGYVDYKRLYKINQCDVFFVTRAKDNMNYRRLYSHPKDTVHGVLYDQTIMLNNYYSALDYPQKMRRIKFMDEDSRKILVFITKNFKLPATDIALLYKYRWGMNFFLMDKAASKN